MVLLVSLCISSGLLIFFTKIKSDLASFWILGASFSRIDRATKYFLHLMSFMSIVGGVLFGLAFLWIFDHFAPEIMPDVFVDRKIPILITAKGLLVSFIVPYVISSVFVSLYKKSIFHNSILAFKNQKRTIKVGDSPSLN